MGGTSFTSVLKLKLAFQNQPLEDWTLAWKLIQVAYLGGTLSQLLLVGQLGTIDMNLLQFGYVIECLGPVALCMPILNTWMVYINYFSQYRKPPLQVTCASVSQFLLTHCLPPLFCVWIPAFYRNDIHGQNWRCYFQWSVLILSGSELALTIVFGFPYTVPTGRGTM